MKRPNNRLETLRQPVGEYASPAQCPWLTTVRFSKLLGIEPTPTRGFAILVAPATT